VKEKTKQKDLDPRERLHTANAIKVQKRNFFICISIFGNQKPRVWQTPESGSALLPSRVDILLMALNSRFSSMS
jgi:hypothetical protein